MFLIFYAITFQFRSYFVECNIEIYMEILINVWQITEDLANIVIVSYWLIYSAVTLTSVIFEKCNDHYSIVFIRIHHPIMK